NRLKAPTTGDCDTFRMRREPAHTLNNRLKAPTTGDCDVVGSLRVSHKELVKPIDGPDPMKPIGIGALCFSWECGKGSDSVSAGFKLRQTSPRASGCAGCNNHLA